MAPSLAHVELVAASLADLQSLPYTGSGPPVPLVATRDRDVCLSGLSHERHML